jgi:hypothetical protein
MTASTARIEASWDGVAVILTSAALPGVLLARHDPDAWIKLVEDLQDTQHFTTADWLGSTGELIDQTVLEQFFLGAFDGQFDLSVLQSRSP